MMVMMMMIVLMTMGTECFTKCCNKVRPVPTLFVIRLFKGQTDRHTAGESVSRSIGLLRVHFLFVELLTLN